MWLSLCLQTIAGDAPSLTEPASKDAEYSRLLVGTWEDQYQGHRTMTIRPDGTATMVVELHGWKAAVYASRLQFEMIWSVENGKMKKRTTGGEPPGRVKTILKMMGNHVTEPILELTSDGLVLLDQDGKHQYHWSRVKAP
jgi:hypothetical protein